MAAIFIVHHLFCNFKRTNVCLGAQAQWVVVDDVGFAALGYGRPGGVVVAVACGNGRPGVVFVAACGCGRPNGVVVAVAVAVACC